jgi:hypothetical protein
VATLRASTVLTPEQSRRLLALPSVRTLEPSPKPDGASWNLRCIGTTLHAFSARRQDGIVPAVKVAANAFSYYRKRLSLSVADRGARAPEQPIELNSWTCVRLIPMDLAVALLPQADRTPATELPERRSLVAGDSQFERIDTPAGVYFRIEDEYFVGTVEYDVDPALIRRVAAVAAASAR